MEKYLDWHYKIYWPRLLTVLFNLPVFPIYFFSVPLHLKTLFTPWKRQIISRKRGFHIDDILSVLAFNIISAVIGFMLRTSVIFYGLILSLILPVLFLPVVLIWPLIPFITYPIYLERHITCEEEFEKILQSNGLKIQILKFCRSRTGNFILLRLGINPQAFIKLINTAGENSEAASAQTIEEFLTKICQYPPLRDEFSALKIKPGQLLECFYWNQNIEKSKETDLILSLKRIKSLSGIGVDWAYGYTVKLDKFSEDLIKKPTPYPLLLGLEKEISQMEQALLKSENNNILIIGEPGMARHVLVSTFAHQLVAGNCGPGLSHKRILQLDMHAVFSEAGGKDKIKPLFSDLLDEALFAGNIILFIDEIDKYFAQGEGRTDLTDVLEKFALSRIGIIGVTTFDEYHGFIEPNPILGKLFNKIQLQPPESSQVAADLKYSIMPVLEKKYPVIITLQALEKTVNDSDRYLSQTPFPGKAVELLEEVVIHKTSRGKMEFLKGEDIDSYLSSKLNLPLGNPEEREKEKLINIEDLLHRKIINQNRAIKLIASALRRSRLNISSNSKPVGSFLFLGPTGVGKTETAKALSEIYFESPQNMNRFDMSQYQGEDGLKRLIGSKGQTGELTSKLREKPFSLLLFDEIEKAPPLILNLFLTLLDEGYITDGNGKKIDCRNSIIIATSNAGSEFIREKLISQTSPSDLHQNVVDHILEKKIFSPEFFNRFDATVVYTPLSEGQLREVAKLMLENLNRRLSKKEISLAVTPELVSYLARLGSNLEFGARSIRREIESSIEDDIAKKLLDGKIEKNHPVNFDIPVKSN